VPPTRLIAGAVALALTVTACSGGDDGSSSRDGDDDTSTSSTEFEKASVELELTRAELVSPHQARGDLDAGTRDAVADVVEQLLLITSAEPLVEGTVGAPTEVASLFTPDAAQRAAETDRAAIFDEGVPRFGKLTTEAATLAMTGLAGSMDPATELVIATFRWDVTSAERPKDRIVREGQLSLVPDDAGRWRIGAYTIVVTRTVDESTTTTTAQLDDDTEDDE
jgi:hypothetical protein